MKRYHVVVSVNAKEDLRRYLRYLKDVKHNGQAARNVMDDFHATRKNFLMWQEVLPTQTVIN